MSWSPLAICWEMACSSINWSLGPSCHLVSKVGRPPVCWAAATGWAAARGGGAESWYSGAWKQSSYLPGLHPPPMTGWWASSGSRRPHKVQPASLAGGSSWQETQAPIKSFIAVTHLSRYHLTVRAGALKAGRGSTGRGGAMRSLRAFRVAGLFLKTQAEGGQTALQRSCFAAAAGLFHVVEPRSRSASGSCPGLTLDGDDRGPHPAQFQQAQGFSSRAASLRRLRSANQRAAARPAGGPQQPRELQPAPITDVQPSSGTVADSLQLAQVGGPCCRAAGFGGRSGVLSAHTATHQLDWPRCPGAGAGPPRADHHSPDRVGHGAAGL